MTHNDFDGINTDNKIIGYCVIVDKNRNNEIAKDVYSKKYNFSHAIVIKGIVLFHLINHTKLLVNKACH